MRKVFKPLMWVAAVALMAAMPAKANAALLTITDTFNGTNTVWTLDIQTSCSVCTATLSAFFQDPAGAATNTYTGQYIDSVQFKIDGTNPTNVNLTGAPGGTGVWDFDVNESLNANECSGGADAAVCGEFIGVSSPTTAGGFGPIVNGSTLTWNMTVTFASALPADLTGDAGNIRAAFNTSTGTNYNIFSPGGGTFEEHGSPAVPEPASLLLLGSGLSAAAWRVRRKKQQGNATT